MNENLCVYLSLFYATTIKWILLNRMFYLRLTQSALGMLLFMAQKIRDPPRYKVGLVKKRPSGRGANCKKMVMK